MNTAGISKHYDHNLEYSVNIYDHLPYTRDIVLCGADKVAVCSGNVVKYYSYKENPPCIIDNQDEKTTAYIRQQELLKRTLQMTEENNEE